MRRLILLAVFVFVFSPLMLVPRAGAMTSGAAPAIKRAQAVSSAVEKVVRVCRHRFFTSRRYCYIDRSRPPTVCHHIRATSRRDCY